ncbi:MAG: molybdate ABC transporter substrate-binding protein [Alphaproteobacteria bacterium]|nr:molybdate ABC transporter substrate-binding protein [Alphaproteobacteria bacterium]
MEHNAARRALLAAMAALAAPAAARPARARQPGLAIAAASSLRPALDEVAAAFRARDGGGTVEIAYGASGNLARQVAAGAPFRAFLAADEASVLQLHAAGHAADRGRVYAHGRLALVARRGGAVAADPRLEGLVAALRAGVVRRVAIANPELAPYGLAARQAMEATGAWPLAAARIALGENVAQAAQFVVAGAAEAGFAALSTALTPGLDARIDFAVVEPGLHAPIRHRMALVGAADARAGRLLDFVLGAEARAILARHGFDPPGEGE